MALLDVGNIYHSDDDAEIVRRFEAACLIGARDILAESGATPNHTNRVSWANGMFSGDLSGVLTRTRQHLRYAISTNSTFQSVGLEVTDGDIGFMVASQIDVFAV